MGGFGRQWSIIEGAGRPSPAVYGNPWFPVQAVACTEIISFPYTPSDHDPPSSKFGLNHPQIAHVRKSVPFRIPAGPAAITSAFLIEADQTLTATVCLLMTHCGHSVEYAVQQVGTENQGFPYRTSRDEVRLRLTSGVRASGTNEVYR